MDAAVDVSPRGHAGYGNGGVLARGRGSRPAQGVGGQVTCLSDHVRARHRVTRTPALRCFNTGGDEGTYGSPAPAGRPGGSLWGLHLGLARDGAVDPRCASFSGLLSITRRFWRRETLNCPVDWAGADALLLRLVPGQQRIEEAAGAAGWVHNSSFVRGLISTYEP